MCDAALEEVSSQPSLWSTEGWHGPTVPCEGFQCWNHCQFYICDYAESTFFAVCTDRCDYSASLHCCNVYLVCFALFSWVPSVQQYRTTKPT
jgi:hypothetical protein